MKGLPFVLLFTAMTFIAWGAYGPVLHHGTDSMGRDSLRAFVGVGIAYFVIAVLVPVSILRAQGETGKWTMLGTFYSLIAGGVGAIGALGVILALAYGGKTIYVMPLVFGFAPIVNTLVTAWLSKTFNQISPIFIGGIVVAALGAGGVIIFKPAPAAQAQHAPSDTKHEDSAKPADSAADEVKKLPEAGAKKAKQQGSSLRLGQARYVMATLIPQEKTNDAAADDGLPPVVSQPPALEQAPANAPAQVKEPAATPKQPVTEAKSQPADAAPALAAESKSESVAKPEAATAPLATPEELPPVVVQPKPLAISAVPLQVAAAPTAAAPPVKEEKVASEKVASEKVASEKVASEKVASEKVASAPAEKPVPAAESASTKVDVQAPAVAEATAEKLTPTEKPAVVKAAPKTDVPMIIVSIIVAALCWGSYGPMLHQGQSRMGGSRLRPFTCVGLAYFFIAVAAPLALISNRAVDTGSWSTGGLSWSIAAGAAGAIGALGVILAFNAGGKPYYVMPLVFGFAPVINTFISLTEAGTWDLVQPMFWVSLAVVIAGAITVLINAPKPQHGKPHAAPAPASGR